MLRSKTKFYVGQLSATWAVYHNKTKDQKHFHANNNQKSVEKHYSIWHSVISVDGGRLIKTNGIKCFNQMNCGHRTAGVRSIVTSRPYVCLLVCLSVRLHNSKTTWPNFTIFLHLALAWFASGGVAIRYILPVCGWRRFHKNGSAVHYAYS